MIRLERQIDALDPELAERVVERLVAEEPDATAVLVMGSYAKGTSAVESDLDLTAITPSPRIGYRTWFEERLGDAPLHVSAGATTADSWLARGERPARWSLGFPAVDTAGYLWTDAETRLYLGADPSRRHPAASPELEDFIESVVKAKRASRGGHALGLRWFAHAAAALAPTLLIPLNDESVVHDQREALDAALGLPVAPAGYAADLAVCLGLTIAVETDVVAGVGRLGRSMLSFLRESAPNVDRQPDLARYLADGTLERHLASVD
jgi:phosphoribosyl-AMP cyclohydrolase